MNKKYFFFDIDGTLNDGKSFFGGIPASTKYAIKELKKQGHVVAIATGRPYVSAKSCAEDAGIENIVCNGGYSCYVNHRCIASKGMNLEDCKSVIQECLNKDIGFCVSTDESFIFKAHNDKFLTSIHQDDFHNEFEVIEDLDYMKLDKIQRILIAAKPGEEKLIENYGTLVPSRYSQTFVMVEPDDKFHGIETMIEQMHGSIEDVVVFGDGLNDVHMFEKAPFSIAMENGVDELKQIADFVTKRCDEDGILHAVKHFKWIRE